MHPALNGGYLIIHGDADSLEMLSSQILTEDFENQTFSLADEF